MIEKTVLPLFYFSNLLPPGEFVGNAEGYKKVTYGRFFAMILGDVLRVLSAYCHAFGIDHKDLYVLLFEEED